MRPHLLNRRVHYWGTLAVAVPLLVVLSTGILLQLKKELSWVQPTEKKGMGSVPTASMEAMLENIRRHPGFESLTWGDVKRIDIRPSKGIAKWTLAGDWEVQLDSESAEVLQAAIRRSDWIEALHDGSYFGGDWTKYGIFLPSALVLLVMWGSGLWLFWHPLQAKWRKRRKSRESPESSSENHEPLRH